MMNLAWLFLYIPIIPVAVGISSRYNKVRGRCRGYDALDVLVGFLWPFALVFYCICWAVEGLYLLLKRATLWLYQLGRDFP